MGAMYNQVLVCYLDRNGKVATSFWTAQDQTAGGASAYSDLADAAQAVSEAAIVAVQFQQTLLLSATPGDGPYCTVFDRCNTLTSIPTSGAPVTFGLVAPKQEIFLPDHKTLDLENDDVITLQDEMMAALGDRLGNAQGPFRRGYRTRARGE